MHHRIVTGLLATTLLASPAAWAQGPAARQAAPAQIAPAAPVQLSQATPGPTSSSASVGASVSVPAVSAGIGASSTALTLSYNGSQWSLPYVEIAYVGIGAVVGAALVDIAFSDSLAAAGVLVGGWLGYKFYNTKPATPLG